VERIECRQLPENLGETLRLQEYRKAAFLCALQVPLHSIELIFLRVEHDLPVDEVDSAVSSTTFTMLAFVPVNCWH
jgi:hypothetical protein